MNAILSRMTAACDWLIRRPAVWGAFAYLAFYASLADRLHADGLPQRLFIADPWPWKAVAGWLFFTGIAYLAMKLVGAGVELAALDRHGLRAFSDEIVSAAEAPAMIEQLEQAPAALQHSHLLKRLRAALEWIQLRQSADGLENRVRQLAEDDRRHLMDGYATVRTITLAIAIIGALGTVVGASTALIAASSDASSTLPQLVLSAVPAADVAVGSLVLALILTGSRLVVSQLESRLFEKVSNAIDTQLVCRITRYGSDRDPRAAAILHTSERVLQSVAAAAAQHDAALTKSLTSASRKWDEMASTAAAVLQRSISSALAASLQEHAQTLSAGVTKHAADLEGVLLRHAEILNEGVDRHTLALAEALEHHAAVLTAAERDLAEENRRHLSEVEASVGEAMLVAASRQEKLIKHSEDLASELQVALVEAAGTTVSHQQQLVRQSELLLKVIEAAGQIRTLEESLNSNLTAVAASHSFEETAGALAAAVQLLAARLRQPAIFPAEVDLRGDTAPSQAA